MPRNCAVIGAGQTPSRGRHEMDAPELARAAFQAAVHDAGIDPSSIDAVVFAIAPEAFEGVNNTDKWLIGAGGGLLKPTMRVHTGGTTGGAAALAAADIIASGRAETVAVVALQRIGQSPDAQKILNTIWDPIYERDFALNTVVLSAFRSARAIELHGITEEHWAKVSVRNHDFGFENPNAHIRKKVTVDDVMASRMLAWPIKQFDACPRSEAACAIIMTSEDRAKDAVRPPVWLQGYASASDTYFIGDRLSDLSTYDFLDSEAQRVAAARAYRMAGITDPMAELDLIELYAPFTSTETQAYEALGFCEPGEAKNLVEQGFGGLDSEVVVNPSGGVQCANPIGATGLIRIAEVYRQLTGTADGIQVPDARRGLVTAVGGSSQFYSVAVLGLDAPDGAPAHQKSEV